MNSLVKKQNLALKQLEKHIINYGKDPETLQTERYYKNRIQNVRDLWTKFKETHDDIIDAISEKPTELEQVYFEKDTYEKYEELYLTYISKLETSATDPIGDQNKGESQMGNYTIKLPRINLPKFSGTYSSWTSFRDLFASLIHNKTSLSEAEKLHYLKASLSGEAEQLVKNFAITDANYEIAWKILNNRYENKRMLVNSQFGSLFKQSNSNETPESVKGLLDNTVECVQALDSLKINNLWDSALVYLTVQKLPKDTRQIWEQQLGSKHDLPTFNDLKSFLEARFRTLEALGSSIPKSFKPGVFQHKYKPMQHQSFLSEQKISCSQCGQDHALRQCPRFFNMSFIQKNEVIKQQGLCINCLGRGHLYSQCPSKSSCSRCGRRHHTLLHIYKRDQAFPHNINAAKLHPTSSYQQRIEEETPTYSSATRVNSLHASLRQREILLATALVTIEGPHGNRQIFRALLDQGSQATLITEHAAQSLHLKKNPVNATISGIGQLVAGMPKAKVDLNLVAPNQDKSIKLQALVLKNLASYLPSKMIVTSHWSHIDGLKLADPTFCQPGKVDLLLGADVYAKLIQDGLKRGPDGVPIAQNTILGWIISGEISNKQKQSEVYKTFTIAVTDNEISQKLQNFWELEEIPTRKLLTQQEEACENHFVKNHTRLDNGRYMVRLPFIDEVHKNALGSSRFNAVSSLLHLERRFANNPSLKREYHKCLNEYMDLGHMHQVTTTESNYKTCEKENVSYHSYYLPHHAVFKESTTTKLRVLFDASRKTNRGLSLNDVLLTGPSIQNVLITILLRWRRYKFAFIADIEKMYRQVKINDSDNNYQRIVWRQDSSEEVKDYCLNTVTFGVTCAPFLAIRTLHQLANDDKEDYPIAAKSLLDEFYVDDLLSGDNTIHDAILKQKQLRTLLQSGGFKLRKWISNDERIMEAIPSEDREHLNSFDLNLDQGVKSLGIIWHPTTDTFSYKLNLDYRIIASTKRELLSDIAKIYDPLGWIAPLTISTKILIQSVWLHGLDWDAQLSTILKSRWEEIKAHIFIIQKLRIPRWIETTGNNKECELHAFSDASQQAYAAVVYLKTINEQEQAKCRIIMAKSKVAPIKTVSIPRLELCGALLAARLIKYIIGALELPKTETYMWTDSSIVLAWIRAHPNKWTTFVSNRTSEIIQTVLNVPWHHVPSNQNPADLASRALLGNEIVENQLWWTGPNWLCRGKTEWANTVEIPNTDRELKKTVKVYFTAESFDFLQNLERFSTLAKLIRVTAYCYRFIRRAKGQVIQYNWFTAEEWEKSLCSWVKILQNISFSQEIAKLKEKKPIDRKSKLRNLNPFLDQQGMLRVGGRLQNSGLNFNERHPVILPKTGHLTQLILQHYHCLCLHGGVQVLLTLLRKRYWLLDARNTIRHFICRCITCYRHKAQTCTQQMGSLPKARINMSKPFTHTGVDYCGPIELKFSKGRKSTTFKGYIAVFVCLAVKAVHLEAVSDLTTSAFIAAFRRFVSRRGLCKHMYSDCGTNFIGANSYLRDIQNHNHEIASKLACEGITGHFIPPYSPHFGGLWEAGVKSAKFHLRRIIGNSVLTFEELSTTLTQVEACMNSRPLCPLTADSSDLTALTPGHFLIGDALLAPPQEDVAERSDNRLNRWQFCLKLLQHFWKRWSSQYLTQLQQRSKWTIQQPNVNKGDMVLVKDDKLPPYKWALGRIVDIHPGNDGLVRVVSIRMKETIVKRPITKIARLPIKDNEVHNRIEAPSLNTEKQDNR